MFMKEDLMRNRKTVLMSSIKDVFSSKYWLWC